MEFNKTFFHYVLPKLYSTSILSTSLLIYSRKKDKHDTKLIMLAFAFGLSIQALLTCFHASLANYLTQYQEEMHLVFSIALFMCTTVVGFDMVKNIEKQKKSAAITRFAVMLTPIVFILNQGTSINLYLIRNKKLTLNAASWTFLTCLFICSLVAIVWYTATSYFSNGVQQCVYSIVVYFTGAIALANTFGYIELIQDPIIVKGLVYTLRQSQKASIGAIRRLINSTMGIKETDASNWIGTGYSLYWICVSFGLIYRKLNLRK